MEGRACEQSLKHGKYFDKRRRKGSVLEMLVSYWVVGRATTQ